MEYEKCHVFEPKVARPNKRRRIEPTGLQASWPSRREAYKTAWSAVQGKIDGRLSSLNATTIEEIAQWLEHIATDHPVGRTPAGFTLTGPNSTLYSALATQLFAKGTAASRSIYVPIASTIGSNLKGVLKHIIHKATSSTYEDDDGDELDDRAVGRKGPRFLNYDLEILHNYVRERDVKQVIIAFEDTEAFDNHLLSDLIELMTCWQDRFSIVLLFNVATSISFLQQRLSQPAARCLQGRAFDSALLVDEVEQVMEVITSPGNTLWLGPSISSMLLERQRDYTQSIDSVVEATRYAYMSHFFANALSMFLSPPSFEEIPVDHFEALRNVASFRSWADGLLEAGELNRLSDVLESDHALMEMTVSAIADGQAAIAHVLQATEVIRSIQASLADTNVSPRTSLYMQAISGKLKQSPMVRALLLSTRKATSDVVLGLTQELVQLDIPPDVKALCSDIYARLDELVQSSANDGQASQPLRSADDVKHSTLRTTVVAQKVELSKQKSALSKQDADYTALLRELTDLLENYFDGVLITPKQLLMHEIFLYDLRSPHREVLTPRPRHAIERALAAPHDYLDCDCCGPEVDRVIASGEGGVDEINLTVSQPATALLYQLYLESGSLINASDFWQAFRAIVDTADEQRTIALFQRGLAELRCFGVIKSTRRRIDHVSKVAWRGL
jgi:origin recognition complex subunit 3